MKKILTLLLLMLFAKVSFAQIPDDPISPVEAVNMLGKGILFEPQSGDVNMALSAPYKPEYGDLIKSTGFKSVRIRYQGSRNPMMIAIAEGPPYDAADDALLDELEGIIDDLLSKDLAVVITFYGLTDDNDGDLEKMTAWWGYVADKFKDKSHRLIFNLFVEPWDLIKNPDHHRIMDYYNAITTEIRKTNPDRLLIYFKIQPQNSSENPYGPGEEYFMTKAYDPVAADAGIYFLWDFHVLKNDTRDNLRLVAQASEYQDSAKQAVWSGAWYSTASDIPQWQMEPMAVNVNRRFIDRGVSYAYLMMFDGHTGIYDAQNDRNGNGILDEWTYPGLEKILTSGPDIWWNLLSNPGFEKDTAKWRTENGTFTISDFSEDHHININGNSSNAKLIQDVTPALKNNGSGDFNALAYVTSSGNTRIKFIISGEAGGNTFLFESDEITVTKGDPVLINEKINADWTGETDKAEFAIVISGDAATIDKTGLTRFFHTDPVLNTNIWPGEKVKKDNYTHRSVSTIDINIQLRSLMKDAVSDNNQEVIPITNAIHDIRISLENRLRTLISDDYEYTSDETQYRTGGYYQGSENKEYSSDVDKYISGKDDEASDLNRQLVEQQDLAIKYFVLNDRGFRELYYDVHRDYPEQIKQEIPIDTTVTANGGTLKANQSGASYRWLDCELLNNPVYDATEQSFSPRIPGKYAVEITLDGFVMRSGCHTVTSPSGIRDKRAEYTTKVFPNPFNDHIFVIPENEKQPFTVELLDIQGRKIEAFSGLDPLSANIRINVQRGVYLLKVVLHDRSEYFKILKN